MKRYKSPTPQEIRIRQLNNDNKDCESQIQSLTRVINKLTWDRDALEIRIKLNNEELWKIQNESPAKSNR